MERKYLFTKKGRSIEGLPPTSAALYYHILRTAYQAGHIWAKSRDSEIVVPSPAEYGWVMESGQWRPYWSNLPKAAIACRELIRCACKSGCKGSCSCKKANFAVICVPHYVSANVIRMNDSFCLEFVFLFRLCYYVS